MYTRVPKSGARVAQLRAHFRYATYGCLPSIPRACRGEHGQRASLVRHRYEVGSLVVRVGGHRAGVPGRHAGVPSLGDHEYARASRLGDGVGVAQRVRHRVGGRAAPGDGSRGVPDEVAVDTHLARVFVHERNHQATEVAVLDHGSADHIEHFVKVQRRPDGRAYLLERRQRPRGRGVGVVDDNVPRGRCAGGQGVYERVHAHARGWVDLA